MLFTYSTIAILKMYRDVKFYYFLILRFTFFSYVIQFNRCNKQLRTSFWWCFSMSALLQHQSIPLTPVPRGTCNRRQAPHRQEPVVWSNPAFTTFNRMVSITVHATGTDKDNATSAKQKRFVTDLILQGATHRKLSALVQLHLSFEHICLEQISRI